MSPSQTHYIPRSPGLGSLERMLSIRTGLPDSVEHMSRCRK